MPSAVLARDSYAVVLAVSPDHDDLEQIRGAMKDWTVLHARNCREASNLLRSRACTAIVSDKELVDGSWTDLLSLANACADPPPVIVMSRIADEDMWVEVLSRGGFDLIPKPLEQSELQRVLPSSQAHSVHARFATA